ncbi:hypothetical protein TrRE_jg8944, partial [Triparma retinervis]
MSFNTPGALSGSSNASSFSSSFIQSTPTALSYPSVSINQFYSSTVILSSMLATSTEVTVSAPTGGRRQYEVTPTKLTIPAYKHPNQALPSGSSPQGVPVTVKVRVASLSSADIRAGGERTGGGIKDYVTVKGDYFEHRIPVIIHLKQPPSSPSSSRPVNVSDPATSAMVDQLQKRVEALSAQNSSLQSTLSKQTGENEHLRSLLDAVEADRGRVRQLVDDEIRRERESFEERSSKVLVILKRRDDTIANLNSQVESLISEQASYKSNNDSIQQRLNEEIDRLQERVIKLSKDGRAAEIRQLEMIQGGVGIDASEIRVNDSQVEDEYRRKIEQQNEQLEVLLTEVNTLRAESSSSLKNDSETVKQLKTENEKLREAKKTLQDEKSILQKAFNDQRLVMDNLKQSYQSQQRSAGHPLNPPASLVEFDQTSKICDLEVKNSQLTSSMAEKEHILKTMTAKVSNLEKLVSSSSNANEAASKKLQVLQPVLKQTEVKYKKAQDSVRDLKDKVSRLEDLNETARNTCTMTEARLQEALTQIDDLTSSSNKNSAMNKEKLRRSASKQSGVMAWWIHIANEAKTKNMKDHEFHPATPLTEVEANRNLVQQGSIISQLRQDLLKADIVNRNAVDDMEERLKAANVRIATLEQSIRIKRDDGLTRMRELESSLRVVSGRSDLHATLAASRQELASERVKEVHQKGELELHVALLEEERGRVKELRARVESLQDEVDLARTVKTLESIPGVDPVAVIEQFACVATEQEKAMNEMKKEIDKCREKKARRRRRRHGGDGGGGDDDDSDNSYDSDASDESDYLPIGSSNPNLNAPHSVDGVEVERLKSQVASLETTLKEYENGIVSEKERSLNQAKDAEQLLSEVREANRRQVGKLERKLATSTSELKTLRSEISELRSSQHEVDEHMRTMNFELERTKQELEVQKKLVRVDEKFKGGESGGSAPEVNAELNRLQSLLDERTSQCAVMMQTVESLQNSLGVIEDGDGDMGLDHSLDGDSLDSSAITGHNSRNMTLAHRNLAKRVITLTAELSSATAVASMMERRAEQMGLEIKQRNELCNYLEAKLAVFAEENEKHDTRARVVAEEQSRTMATFNKEISNFSNDNGALRRALHESELKVRDADVETSALSADVVVLEEIVYNLRKKLKEEVESKEYEGPGEGTSSAPGISEEAKNSLDFEDQMRVVSVVEQFVDKLQQMRSSTTSRRTKSQDDQIFAWVTDVIVKTDDQNLKTASRARDLQTKLRKTLAERDIALLDNEEIKAKLARTMKKVALVEEAMEERVKLNIAQTEDAIALSDRRMVAIQNDLVSVSEKDLYICAEHRTITKQLENSKKENKQLKKEAAFLKSELKQANHVARVKASKEIDEKVGESEEKLKQWVEAELPQLVNGKASAGKEWNDYSRYDDEAERAAQVSGSLAQALATSKAVQHKLEAKLDVALSKFDAANGIVEELRRELHDVMLVGGVVGESEEGGERGGVGRSGNESMARLWELYSPTGIQTSILSPGAGEPNPTFQNLMAEVDSLRVQVKLAEGASGVAEQEQTRLTAWLKEARGDAANAQEQLGKRTNAIRTELERRHAKEITAMQQHGSQQHAAQVHALGQLRAELLTKETSLQECKLRLQLFGDNGKNGVEAKDINTGEISFHPPIVQTNALMQERDYLLQKNDSLVEELKTCSVEKVGLENECERLVGEKASIKAETEHLSEELSIHRSALRALEESVSAAVVGDIGGNGEISVETLGRSLASAKLAEAQAIQRLQIAAQNEVRLRFKVEEGERSIRELKRLAKGEGYGEGVGGGGDAGEKRTPATDAAEEGMSPWMTESVAKLRQRVSTQASAIAYLELRIAQMVGEIGGPGDSGVQNLRRELAESREGKLALERELEEAKEQMKVRGKLALTVLDENSTRIEGEAELSRMRQEEKQRSKEMEKMESDVELMQEKTREEESMRMSIQDRLQAKEDEVVSMKELLKRMRSEQRKMFAEYKEQGEKLLELGGGKGRYFGDGGKVDLGMLREKPLFLAADNLFTELSGWAEKLGQGSSGSEMVWEDIWELTQLASEVRELAGVAENLPTNLMGGMEELKTKIGDLAVEVEQREERVVEIADNAVTEMSVEAIQKLRAQVMLLKKRAEEGELYRKELAAENDALRVGVGKHQEEIGGLRKQMMKVKVAGDEEVAELRRELVALKKSSWEQTQNLREKYGKTIKEMEEASDRQSAVASEEVHRLEAMLAEAEGEKRVRDAAFGAPVRVERVERAERAGGRGYRGEGNGDDRAQKLQGLLDKAAEEAEESAGRLKSMEEELNGAAKSHDDQVAMLREQFGRYREAQSKLVAGLNSQIKSLKSGSGSPGRGGGGGAGAFSRTAARIRRDKRGKQGGDDDKRGEIEELMAALEGAEVQRNGLEVRLKRLHVEYKSKSEEFEAAKRSAFEITSEPNQLVASSLVERAVLETRCDVLQAEMRGILSDLGAEKDVSANLRRELAAAVLQTATVRSEKATNQPKVQGVLKQLADYKRRAKVEISNLNTQLEKMRTASRDSGDAGALKKKNEQYSSALGLAREDLSRKNKIVMNLRNSRAADEKAVAQWKAAVEEMEEKMGKAKGELSRKVGLIEELKRKVARLEEGGVGEGGGSENVGGVGNEIGEGGGDEKIRSLTLERTRIRQQVSLLRSKVQQQQEEIDRLSKEKGKVQGLEGKINLLKASIVRKDSLLSALKNQIDTTEKEFLLYKKSADASYGALEKKNRVLVHKVKEEGKKEEKEKEEEAERMELLERKKESLASELANIKGNMYQIMGDLYSANAKARGSPAQGGGGGLKSPEKLDEDKLAAISDLLDLSTTEMQEIFETGRNDRS